MSDRKTMQQVQALASSLHTLPVCARQLGKDFQFLSYDPAQQSIQFQVVITEQLQNLMWNMYGGAAGLFFDIITAFLMALVDDQKRMGSTVHLSGNFLRATPVGTTCIIHGQLKSFCSQTGLAVFDTQLETDSHILLVSGSVTRHVTSSATLDQMYSKPEQVPILQNPPSRESPSSEEMFALDNVHKGNFPFIEDESLSPVSQRGVQKAVYWIIAGNKFRSHLVDFSGTVDPHLRFSRINVAKQLIEMEMTVSEIVVDPVGNLSAGALFTLIDTVSSTLKLIIEKESVQFVSIFIEMKQMIQRVPLGETIRIVSRCDKPGKRFYFMPVEFWYKEECVCVGYHIMTPAVMPKL